MTHSRDLTVAQEMRLFGGFAVQPFAAAVLGFITFPILDLSGRALYGGASADSMGAAISVALGAGLAGAFVTVFGAFPLVAWLLTRGPLTLKQALWGGVILGNLPFAIIVPLAAMTNSADAGPSWFGPTAVVRALAFGALFGVVGATLFWLIAIRGNSVGPPAELN